MYETFFRFRQRPFLASPTMERYFPAPAIEHARQSLLRCVERAQGTGVLIGPAGTGKSLVCQILADQLAGSYRVALLANTRLSTRKSLLQSLLFELGLPFRGLDEGEMRLSLIQHIEPSADCPNGLLLIVDEAHSLPLRLFEELRALTNVVRQGRARVQLVLAGGPLLEERFTHPKLESFHQRIAARCYLSALQRSETFDYVLAQLAWVDAPNQDLFPPESLEAIYRATDGIPRLINQVCDLALSMAAEQGRSLIEPRQIEEAWAELQQLPAPWHNPTPSSSSSGSSIVEFGSLDDEPLASPPSASVEFGTLSATSEAAVEPWQSTPRVEQVPEELPSQLFGEGFTEQEVVVDRFATAREASIATRLRVSSGEGKELGALLQQASTSLNLPQSAAAETSLGKSENAEDALLHAIRSLPPVDDPQRWTPGAWSAWDYGGTMEPQMALPFGAGRTRHDLPLLDPPVMHAPVTHAPVIDAPVVHTHVVQSPAVETPPTSPDSGRAPRPEYRRLFSRLRRG